ncbi:hypothetical protein HY345_04315 [Candidatus Microgenomates bacterium]|nr:hypothetical protein [Candidatus Microgenomates bacterium]
MTSNTKKRKRNILADNPIEAVRSIASDVGNGATDMMGDVAENAFQQIFGTPASNNTLSPNEELNFDEFSPQTDRRAQILAYQKQREQIERNAFSYQESIEVQKKIQELLSELKKLAASTESLSQDVQVAIADKTPVDPGKYHLNFLEWLLLLVKSLREKVDESQTWLAVFSSKKKQRQYWNMFKKHGTTFGLSHERVVATQTG